MNITMEVSREVDAIKTCIGVIGWQDSLCFRGSLACSIQPLG